MNDIATKGPDEIYCPNCAKPINKDAVVCPKCGVQIKELRTTPEVVQQPVDEITEGKLQLGGIRGWFWFVIVIFGLVFIGFIISSFIQNTQAMSQTSSIIGGLIAIAIWLALFIVPLVGIAQRKPFAVPFTRTMLIISMFWFPIGTIVGATLWKRINHPSAKKYLNYFG